MKSGPARLVATLLMLFVVLTTENVVCAVDSSAAGKNSNGEHLYDIIIYGDSSGAVIAAISAKREGRSVILVNPTSFLGGMSASGLGAHGSVPYAATLTKVQTPHRKASKLPVTTPAKEEAH